jgi:hypothetical protein
MGIGDPHSHRGKAIDTPHPAGRGVSTIRDYRLFFASKFLLLALGNPFISNLFRPLTSFL